MSPKRGDTENKNPLWSKFAFCQKVSPLKWHVCLDRIETSIHCTGMLLKLEGKNISERDRISMCAKDLQLCYGVPFPSKMSTK